MNAVSRAYARMLLIRKAKRGIWDPRMCSIHGCDPRVNLGCRRFITRGYAAKLIPTSTLRFPVGGGSYHQARNEEGQGMAADLGVVPALVGTKTHRRRLVEFQRAEFEAWEKGERPRLVELIGPGNQRVVLRGKHVPLVEGTALENQHDNHCHGAFR